MESATPGVKSTPDGWLNRFLQSAPEANATPFRAVAFANSMPRTMMGDAPFCNICGHITVRNGACYKCLNCGDSLGCS